MSSSYKEKLLEELRDAQIELDALGDDEQVRHTKFRLPRFMDSASSDGLISYLLRMANIKPEDIEGSSLYEDLEYIEADIVMASMIISSEKNNKLFKQLGFDDKDEQSYRKSVRNFKYMKRLVELSAGENINTTIPIRPRDNLNMLIRGLKELECADDIIRIAICILFPEFEEDSSRRPRDTNLVKEIEAEPLQEFMNRIRSTKNN